MKTESARNEAALKRVSLRSQLEYEVTGRAVKGQDERSLRDALDSSPRHHRRGYAGGKQLIKVGRHVGLDFYDLLIEGDYTHLRGDGGI